MSKTWHSTPLFHRFLRVSLPQNNQVMHTAPTTNTTYTINTVNRKHSNKPGTNLELPLALLLEVALLGLLLGLLALQLRVVTLLHVVTGMRNGGADGINKLGCALALLRRNHVSNNMKAAVQDTNKKKKLGQDMKTWKKSKKNIACLHPEQKHANTRGKKPGKA